MMHLYMFVDFDMFCPKSGHKKNTLGGTFYIWSPEMKEETDAYVAGTI